VLSGEGRIQDFNLMTDPLSNPLFQRYLELLLKWNKTYNLTSITEPQAIRRKHFEDSLAPLKCLPKPCRLLDVGCGAGFPGIPLKIARTDLEVVLLDSIRKKVAFCQSAIRELSLENIQAVQGRAEETKLAKDLGSFDVIITRATVSINQFLEIAQHFAKENSLAISMKGPNWRKEGHAHEIGFWGTPEIVEYQLGGENKNNALLIFKNKNSPL